jgi:hypothetical protein
MTVSLRSENFFFENFRFRSAPELCADETLIEEMMTRLKQTQACSSLPKNRRQPRSLWSSAGTARRKPARTRSHFGLAKPACNNIRL